MSGIDTRYQYEVTALAGEYSEPVFFPRRVNDITVQALPGAGGSATVYYTMDAADEVKQNPNGAQWDAWEPDAVTTNTARVLAGPVTALRLGAVADAAVMKIVGSYDF